jgi:hypothetical protein
LADYVKFFPKKNFQIYFGEKLDLDSDENPQMGWGLINSGLVLNIAKMTHPPTIRGCCMIVNILLFRILSIHETVRASDCRAAKFNKISSDLHSMMKQYLAPRYKATPL